MEKPQVRRFLAKITELLTGKVMYAMFRRRLPSARKAVWTSGPLRSETYQMSPKVRTSTGKLYVSGGEDMAQGRMHKRSHGATLNV
ncbi:hypothetical protein PV08_06631 [Exophiala spinifera]|uniref:Uncharacterized protein n=1 Tax=Exophiala spinifera TaxID=91928 RepID=A0A0D1YFK8_9EURO|nr:uncharacterized protein PV08_06631 [Exophiala spinifera]KIW13851.1 hypothetical protein PV08_06631 [Exophiala spinifera]